MSYYRQIINAKWKLVSLASVNLAARQFLAIAYFASLVTASDLAGLTALYLLRENFKLLIFLKFLIVCHAQPYAYGFAVIPNGMDIPGFAVTSLQVVHLPALYLLQIQKILFSFLKRWRVLGRRKNLFCF